MNKKEIKSLSLIFVFLFSIFILGLYAAEKHKQSLNIYTNENNKKLVIDF